MTRILFTADWTFSRRGEGTTHQVRLPHDAMIAEPRSADAPTGNHGGYFLGGQYEYSKQWNVPLDSDVDHRLVFDGVYGTTEISIDGTIVADSSNGFQQFVVDLPNLTPGATVTIGVAVDNTKLPNSRWYTGAGIYRPVWIESRSRTRFADDGLRLTTNSVGTEAQVRVDMGIEGAIDGVVAVVRLYDGDEIVAEAESAVVEREASVDLLVDGPQLWSAESPHLYELEATLMADDATIDRKRIKTGLRTVAVSASRGLEINGQRVLLRGACVHSDNGVLGAVSLKAAEYRRVRILKESGYNAVRASHNPASPYFLDACDEVGLYVLDELTDVWSKHKTPHDGADRFEQAWRSDASAMVAEDRNRPSVIMYSIGNEIGETAVDAGVEVSRKLSEFFRHLDPTRPTTIAVNFLLNLMGSRGSSPFDSAQYSGEPESKKQATSTAANAMTAKLGSIMALASRLPAADKATRQVLETVDVAGYNYAYARYRADRRRYPDRVILGTESMPGDLPAIWSRVTEVPGVIGDFMWTGWDYIGEAGIGTWSYGSEFGGINKPYPALLAGTGAIDITGRPGAPSFLAQAVWGLLDAPKIAVRPLDQHGARANKTPWRSTDAIESWSWGSAMGAAEVEIYSSDSRVELLVNGRSIGKRSVPADHVVRFQVAYEPGEIVAVGYRNGREHGRSALKTADSPSLRLRVESPRLVGPDDLAFIWVEMADALGVVDSLTNDEVTVTVDGPASLLGFGSAVPITSEGFSGSHHGTYYGRALAVVRGTGETGTITVRAESAKYGSSEIAIESVTESVPVAP